VTFSTVLAAFFVVAFVVIIVSMLRSLLTGRPSMRRGSGRPGMPYSGGSGWGGGDSSSDSGGFSGGDGGGGGGD
jgi:uncharacterized protein